MVSRNERREEARHFGRSKAGTFTKGNGSADAQTFLARERSSFAVGASAVSVTLPQLFESGGTTPLSSLAFGTVATGTDSDVLSFDAWNANGDGSAETAKACLLSFGEKLPGDDFYRPDGPIGYGRWAEFRVVGSLGNASPLLTDWTPAGLARPFALGDLLGDSGYQIEARVSVPGNAEATTADLLLSLTYNAGPQALATGFEAAGVRGIVLGLGDGGVSYLVSGGLLTQSGSPDANIQVGAVEWVYQGVPYGVLPQALATDGDASDRTLTSGESYLITLSLGSSVTVTKSVATTAPASIALRPAVPPGEILLGYVERLETAAIATADIAYEGVPGLFAMSGSGLTRALGPGSAMLDDRLDSLSYSSSVTFTGSQATVALWRLPSGAFAQVLDGSRPDRHALLFYRGATGSSDFSALEDCRPFVRGKRREIRIAFDGGPLVANQVAYGVYDGHSDGLLWPVAGITLAVSDGGIGTGSTTVDVHWWDGSAWQSLFPGSGTTDLRPAVAAGASILTASGFAEVRVIPPMAPLRVKVISVPLVTAPAAGLVTMQWEEM